MYCNHRLIPILILLYISTSIFITPSQNQKVTSITKTSIINIHPRPNTKTVVKKGQSIQTANVKITDVVSAPNTTPITKHGISEVLNADLSRTRRSLSTTPAPQAPTIQRVELYIGDVPTVIEVGLFGRGLNRNSTVRVDNQSCTIIENTHETIICKIMVTSITEQIRRIDIYVHYIHLHQFAKISPVTLSRKSADQASLEALVTRVRQFGALRLKWAKDIRSSCVSTWWTDAGSYSIPHTFSNHLWRNRKFSPSLQSIKDNFYEEIFASHLKNVWPYELTGVFTGITNKLYDQPRFSQFRDRKAPLFTGALAFFELLILTDLGAAASEIDNQEYQFWMQKGYDLARSNKHLLIKMFKELTGMLLSSPGLHKLTDFCLGSRLTVEKIMNEKLQVNPVILSEITGNILASSQAMKQISDIFTKGYGSFSRPTQSQLIQLENRTKTYVTRFSGYLATNGTLVFKVIRGVAMQNFAPSASMIYHSNLRLKPEHNMICERLSCTIDGLLEINKIEVLSDLLSTDFGSNSQLEELYSTIAYHSIRFHGDWLHVGNVFMNGLQAVEAVASDDVKALGESVSLQMGVELSKLIDILIVYNSNDSTCRSNINKDNRNMKGIHDAIAGFSQMVATLLFRDDKTKKSKTEIFLAACLSKSVVHPSDKSIVDHWMSQIQCAITYAKITSFEVGKTAALRYMASNNGRGISVILKKMTSVVTSLAIAVTTAESIHHTTSGHNMATNMLDEQIDYLQNNKTVVDMIIELLTNRTTDNDTSIIAEDNINQAWNYIKLFFAKLRTLNDNDRIYDIMEGIARKSKRIQHAVAIMIRASNQTVNVLAGEMFEKIGYNSFKITAVKQIAKELIEHFSNIPSKQVRERFNDMIAQLNKYTKWTGSDYQSTGKAFGVTQFNKSLTIISTVYYAVKVMQPAHQRLKRKSLQLRRISDTLQGIGERLNHILGQSDSAISTAELCQFFDGIVQGADSQSNPKLVNLINEFGSITLLSPRTAGSDAVNIDLVSNNGRRCANLLGALLSGLSKMDWPNTKRTQPEEHSYWWLVGVLALVVLVVICVVAVCIMFQRQRNCNRISDPGGPSVIVATAMPILPSSRRGHDEQIGGIRYTAGSESPLMLLRGIDGHFRGNLEAKSHGRTSMQFGASQASTTHATSPGSPIGRDIVTTQLKEVTSIASSTDRKYRSIMKIVGSLVVKNDVNIQVRKNKDRVAQITDS